MKTLAIGILCAGLAVVSTWAQNTLTVSATPIPASLLKQNYGRMPRNVGGYDLNICNASMARQMVISSRIYQAIVQHQAGVQPIGKQIMLAAILHSQNSNFFNILNVSLESASGVLSILSSTHNIPPKLITGTSLASLALQQLLTNLKPYSPVTALQQFDTQVLETAVSLDSGSCVERTVFTLSTGRETRAVPLSFHVD
ncbi:MAG TPA: hypothetical protein VHW45_20835 [Candidatus Sulfotelmatobacter sp.]|jgi:hypothetical protein|nr:hypothetical protein [Candidatus Sulfotelmatobacter sp.]